MGSGGWVGLGVTLGAADRVATDAQRRDDHTAQVGPASPYLSLQGA